MNAPAQPSRPISIHPPSEDWWYRPFELDALEMLKRRAVSSKYARGGMRDSCIAAMVRLYERIIRRPPVDRERVWS
ncbi:MAG: hypothetical protein ABJA82_01880 [Myxococcales bacterium]